MIASIVENSRRHRASSSRSSSSRTRVVGSTIGPDQRRPGRLEPFPALPTGPLARRSSPRCDGSARSRPYSRAGGLGRVGWWGGRSTPRRALLAAAGRTARAPARSPAPPPRPPRAAPRVAPSDRRGPAWARPGYSTVSHGNGSVQTRARPPAAFSAMYFVGSSRSSVSIKLTTPVCRHAITSRLR
jgi:hypothetical protein